ncbi:MAG: YidC/Oxa1 family rane protein insertase [Streptosporangiaceae bacterium]|nr:YidC/Oxa1 family rane protein insertase [Streptosporangiaceae bacterium]
MTNPLTPLYDAVAWVIMRLHAGLGAIFGDSSGAAWALSIVVLVVLMRLLLVPLFIKQMHATRKMTALAPQVAELKKKYKNDRQKLNEETMKMYKENGANPLAGCLPVVAQLPVFFALFSVLRAIAEDQPKYGLTPAVVHSAQHAQIFGVVTVADRLLTSIFPPVFSSLGTSQKVVILLTVVVSAATTFMTVRQSMKRGMTPQMDPNNPMASSQKMMQYIVPVFALSGLYWQYGLVLYWVTTNLWTLGQQYVLFRRFPPPATATAGASGTPATSGGKSAARQAGKGAPAKPAPNVTAAGRAAARQQAAAKAAPSAKADGAQPASGNGTQPAKPAAAQAGRPAINQLRKGSGKPETGKPETSKPETSKPTRGKQSGSRAAKPASPAAATKGTGSGSNGGGGLRRLVKGRTEPEAPAPEPETKIVRQQPVRQPRSRRSGKR